MTEGRRPKTRHGYHRNKKRANRGNNGANDLLPPVCWPIKKIGLMLFGLVAVGAIIAVVVMIIMKIQKKISQHVELEATGCANLWRWC